MVNAALTMFANPRDLRLQRGDTGVELGDGERIQILPAEFGQKIAAFAGEEFLHVHARSVDRSGPQVNKSRGEAKGGM